MNINVDELARSGSIINKIRTYYNSKIVGQSQLGVSLLVSMIANGHVLLESVPGLAKTQARAENIIGSNYADKQIDAWLCSNDSTAQGVVNALDSRYTLKDKWPIVTGQDCDIVSVKNMIAGKQSMSVFKDTRTLAERTVTMVNQILDGKEVETNNTYNNNKKEVASYLCDPVFADKDSIQKILIDSGYYKAADLGL